MTQTEITIPVPTRFCEKCGRQLEYKGLEGAESFGFYPYLGLENKFDRYTGKRRMRHYLECPKRGKWFSDGHDGYAFGDEVLVDEPSPKEKENKR